MSQPVEGLLIIDKPAGLTSHDVVNKVRWLSGQRRVGHAGTLDPLATGLLLLAIGRTTRLIEYLVGQSKIYQAVIRLGQETNTYDAAGELLAERPVLVNDEQLQAALAQFRGPIHQVPPMFSAIKKDGQPLYKLARQGQEVDRPARPVTIYQLLLLQWQPPQLELQIHCSSGTYIRSLAHDLGQVLGCGGHLAGLRRLAVGPFSLADAVPLAELTPDNWPAWLLPGDRAVSHLPAVSLPEAEAQELRHGRQIACQPDHPAGPLVRAYSDSGLFIGILGREGAGQESFWQPHKIMAAAGA